VRAQPDDLQATAIIEAMGRDKKRTGSGLALVMLTEAGEMVRVNDVEAHEVQAALKEAVHSLCEGSPL
jgi:3-dehydroquinate synthetase